MSFTEPDFGVRKQWHEKEFTVLSEIEAEVQKKEHKKVCKIKENLEVELG